MRWWRGSERSWGEGKDNREEITKAVKDMGADLREYGTSMTS